MKGLVLTYLLAYGGAVAALFNPFIGVCIYWIFDLVRPQYMFAWAGTKGAFSQIIAVATILGWAARGFGSWSFGKGTLIYAFFVASSVWTLLSAMVAPQTDVAMHFVMEDLKRALMFTIAITTAVSIRRTVQLAWVVVGSAGFVALDLNLRYLEGVNEVQMAGYGGMDNNCLAISMVTCLGIAVFLALYVQPFWQKSIAFGAAALIGHTVLLTFSRGGMLGMVVSAAVALAIVPKRPRNLLAIVGAIVLGVMLAGPEVRARFMTSFEAAEDLDGSAQSRKTLWWDCVTVMKAYPIFGVGPDHFPLIVEEFGWRPGKEAHSLWLQVGAEVGIAGMMFLLLFYLLIIWRLWRFARRRGTTDVERWSQTAACMTVTSLAGFMISAQFVSLEGLEAPLYASAIGLATLRLMAQRGEVAEVRPGWLPIHAGRVGTASARGFEVPPRSAVNSTHGQYASPLSK